ncbi:F-box protein [Camellia lanceoleosa]|uniref:F-box protein n=1 Tax=Camellia lanceoleosa TaxID=1840588 RepID=A0ACC0I6A6_9ERIC|nr:F-box protein [Camellia lanceoleosa]
MKVALHDRDPIWVTFKYERLSNFCYFCGRLGHGDRECPAQMLGGAEAERHGDQYGTWLRASPLHMHAKPMKDTGGSTATVPSIKKTGGSLSSLVMERTAPRNTTVEAPAESEAERPSGEIWGDIHADFREDTSPNMDIVIPSDLMSFKRPFTREISVVNEACEGGVLGVVVHDMEGPGAFEVAHNPVVPDCSVLGLSGGPIQETLNQPRSGPTLILGQDGLRADKPVQAPIKATSLGNKGGKKWKNMARTLDPVLSPVLHGGEKRQRDESRMCDVYDGKRVGLMSYSSGHIDSLISGIGLLDWRFTGFYGNLVSSQRNDSWTLLRRLLALGHGPWMIAGDFNEILFQHEKDGVSARCQVQMEAFRLAVQDWELVDLGFSGPPVYVEQQSSFWARKGKMSSVRPDLTTKVYPEPYTSSSSDEIDHFNLLPDSILLLIFNKIGDVKALGLRQRCFFCL